MSDITQVVKVLCALPHPDVSGGATPVKINPATMRGAFASILDGGASDLEIGSLMTVSATLEAQHAAEWFAEVILGLNDAIRDRMTPLFSDVGSSPVVVLPNYGNEQTLLTLPLIALLLRRLGIRVLIHGALETHAGLLNCSILREFGVLPAVTRSQAGQQMAENGLALLPASLFAPGLAAMLSLRNRLGIRTPAHTLANMLMPVFETSGRALHVIYIAPWLRSRLADENLVLDSPALMVSNHESSERMWFEHGAHIEFREGGNNPGWQVLQDTKDLTLHRRGPTESAFAQVPDMNNPREWAEWTRHRLEGKTALPQSVAGELACCIYGCGFARDYHQAKAIAAVETGAMAAA